MHSRRLKSVSKQFSRRTRSRFGKRMTSLNCWICLRDKGRTLPPHADSLDTLNPFAVTLRYDLFEAEPTDRDWIANAAASVRSWAETEVESSIKPEIPKTPANDVIPEPE